MPRIIILPDVAASNGKPDPILDVAERKRRLREALRDTGLPPPLSAAEFHRLKHGPFPYPGFKPLSKRINGLQELLSMVKPVPAEWLEPSSEEKEHKGVLVTRCLADVEPEPVEFTWEKRILRGKLNIIHGDPGVGKTYMVLDILARVTTGRPFCDGAQCEAGDVLFATAEDAIADTIRPRLDKLGADVRRAEILELVRIAGREVSLDLDQHLGAIDDWLRIHPGVRVVALDPLAAFVGTKRDSYRNNEVRAVLGRVAAMAERRKVAIIGIDHLSKGQGKAMYRGIGSIAFTAAPRAVWQVRKDPDDPGRSLFLPMKMNLAKVDGLAFRIVDDGGMGKFVWEKGAVTLTPDDVEAKSGGTSRAEAKDWLRAMLHQTGRCLAKEIEQKARGDGICLATLKYAKKEMGVVSYKDGAGAWYWSYPTATRPFIPLDSLDSLASSKEGPKEVKESKGAKEVKGEKGIKGTLADRLRRNGCGRSR
jgi:hypothetical protein